MPLFKKVLGFVALCAGFTTYLAIGKLRGVGEFPTWSWWWITCPLWAPWVLLTVLSVVLFLTAGLYHIQQPVPAPEADSTPAPAVSPTPQLAD